MKKASWIMAAGIVILVSGTLALLMSSGVVRVIRAQTEQPPSAGMTPPGSEASLPISFPPDENLPIPPPPSSDWPPQVPSDASALPLPADPTLDPGLAPPPMPIDSFSSGGTPPMDPSQDPVIKTMNPEGFVYDPSGRRDPFLPVQNVMRPPVPIATPSPAPGESPDAEPIAENGKGDPLLSYKLKEYKLIGVLWDVRQPRAMVRTPSNEVYMLQLKSRIGREKGVVAAIREREVVVVVPDREGNYLKGEAKTLRMRN